MLFRSRPGLPGGLRPQQEAPGEAAGSARLQNATGRCTRARGVWRCVRGGAGRCGGAGVWGGAHRRLGAAPVAQGVVRGCVRLRKLRGAVHGSGVTVHGCGG